MHIEHTALLVDDYDEAIGFFVDALGFDLVEDSPATTNDGRAKRWVVVRPPNAQTGLLLAQADGERQSDTIGDQYAGRVGLFLRVDDFEDVRQRMLDHDVEFVTDPATSRTGGWQCSSTSRATSGISSGRRPAESQARSSRPLSGEPRGISDAYAVGSSGGCSSTRGRYSTSWMRSSKVR